MIMYDTYLYNHNSKNNFYPAIESPHRRQGTTFDLEGTSIEALESAVLGSPRDPRHGKMVETTELGSGRTDS